MTFFKPLDPDPDSEAGSRRPPESGSGSETLGATSGSGSATLLVAPGYGALLARGTAGPV